jgi:hypothetical protein
VVAMRGNPSLGRGLAMLGGKLGLTHQSREGTEDRTRVDKGQCRAKSAVTSPNRPIWNQGSTIFTEDKGQCGAKIDDDNLFLVQT